MKLLIKSQNIARNAKCAILILVMVLLICVLINWNKTSHMMEDDNRNLIESKKFFTAFFIDEKVTSCLKTLQRNDLIQGFESDHPTHGHPVLKFNNLITSLKIQMAIIEPAFLYCVLRPSHQELLSRRRFNISDYLGSKSVVTFGITGEDAYMLAEEQSVKKFRKEGFLPYFHYSETEEWMQRNNDETPKSFISHIFFTFYHFTFHLVVFHKRNDYLWQAEFHSEEMERMLPREKLLYVNHDASFENFTYVSLMYKSQSLNNFYIPSNPHFFLFEIPSSRFLECGTYKLEVVENETVPTAHGHLSVEDFNNFMIEAIREIKTLFNSQLINFWMFSGTALGWYRECGVIPYTSDGDFGAWAADVDDVNFFLNYFQKNKILGIAQRMGILDRGLEFRLVNKDLWVDIFFMYRVDNGSWSAGHRPSGGYYFRYYYPHFTLCSAELLNSRVLVPCEAEKVLVAEYGPDWRKPVSYWNYETSIFNRGPNIYWEDEVKNLTYEEY